MPHSPKTEAPNASVSGPPSTPPGSPGRITDVVGTPGDTGLIIGDFFIAPGHKRMILMADHKRHGVWLAGVGDYLDDDWYGSRAEFDAAGWTPVNQEISDG